MGNTASDHEQDSSEFQFLEAANNGDTAKMQGMLRSQPEIVYKAQTKDGQSAWHFAAQAGQLKILEMLHSPGVPLPPPRRQGGMGKGGKSFTVNDQDKKGQTALLLASDEGHAECVRFLLRIGADPWLACTDGTICLHRAAKGNHVGCVLNILEHEGAATTNSDPSKRLVDARNKVGLTPLHVAVYFSHVETSKALIEHGARLTSQSKVDSLDIVTCNGGSTPLHVAALRDNVPVVRLLLDHYVQSVTGPAEGNGVAMPDLRAIRDNYGLIPVQNAQNMKNTSIIPLLDPSHTMDMGPARSGSIKAYTSFNNRDSDRIVELQSVVVAADSAPNLETQTSKRRSAGALTAPEAAELGARSKGGLGKRSNEVPVPAATVEATT